jgi:DNA repair exonuclease SbcCD ATPase subunit
LKKQLGDLLKEQEAISTEKQYYDFASTLLKDGGIKTKIIKQYLPVMNKLINKYLAAMDFFANFNINENFEEIIKSRHRDEFSYDSFSEGEKMRIDLALLFTWRQIAKLKNSTNTNLLILDEVFDSSLDTVGTDEFLKLLHSLDNDTNVFVISHKGDQLFDKFRSVIRFEKKNNFSRIAK